MKSKVTAGCSLLLIAAFGTAQAANNSTNAYYEVKNVIFWSKSDPISAMAGLRFGRLHSAAGVDVWCV